MKAVTKDQCFPLLSHKTKVVPQIVLLDVLYVNAGK